MKKQRIDLLLVERGHFPSRERARAAIMAGLIFTGEQRIEKAGEQVDEAAPLEVRGADIPFASRGGLKLEKALDTFGVSVAGRKALDVGASTGGFTDCLLQRGAAKVWAIDVGYGQLAWELRQDARVVVMERTNIRHVTPEQIGDTPDLAVVDVSFISLRLVLPVVKTLLAENCEIICLIKPQFEVGRGKVGKSGVVRDPLTHIEVLQNFRDGAQGVFLAGLTFSPITGPKGNIEFLAHLKPAAGELSFDIPALVTQAHETFKKGE